MRQGLRPHIFHGSAPKLLLLAALYLTALLYPYSAQAQTKAVTSRISTIRDQVFLSTKIGQQVNGLYYHYTALAAWTLDGRYPAPHVVIHSLKKEQGQLESWLSYLANHGVYVAHPVRTPTSPLSLKNLINNKRIIHFYNSDHLPKLMPPKARSIVYTTKEFRQLSIKKWKSPLLAKLVTRQKSQNHNQKMLRIAHFGLTSLSAFLGKIHWLFALLLILSFFAMPNAKRRTQWGIGLAASALCLMLSIKHSQPAPLEKLNLHHLPNAKQLSHQLVSAISKDISPKLIVIKKGAPPSNKHNREHLVMWLKPFLSSEHLPTRLNAIKLVSHYTLRELSQEIRANTKEGILINLRYHAYNTLRKLRTPENRRFLGEQLHQEKSPYVKLRILKALIVHNRNRATYAQLSIKPLSRK